VNPWPFIIAAYGIVVAGTLALVLASWLGMRSAEAAAETSRTES
jgi:hypothetical protein